MVFEMGNKNRSLLEKQIIIMGDGSDVIQWFRKENAFLSNFYPCQVTYLGEGEERSITYANSEAAFQAQKSNDIKERTEFATLDGKTAKQKGKGITPFDAVAWNRVSYEIMENVVRAKFSQNKDLKERLLATGDKKLIEGSRYDFLWGAQVRNISAIIIRKCNCFRIFLKIVVQENNNKPFPLILLLKVIMNIFRGEKHG